MNVEMKYVVVSSELGQQLFIFPKSINHNDFAEVLSHIRHEKGVSWERVYKEPVSAGFTDGVTCYGKSESLSLKSSPNDTALLKAGGFLES